MASVLVSYGTGEGQTARIAGWIADELRERGHDAVTARGSVVPPSPSPGGLGRPAASETRSVSPCSL